jgi:hypothetical protein
MAQTRVFALIGDSNIRRHVNRMSRKANPGMKNCQVIPCGSMELLNEALVSVPDTANVCLLACVTNFITGAPNTSTSVGPRVSPVLDDLVSALGIVVEARPTLKVLVSPPMYRTSPVWYRDGLPEILSKFSEVFKESGFTNVHLLPSFATPDFESDGVHLTSYSGLEFITHLFEESDALLDNLAKTPTERCNINLESTRVLQDRMMVLEQDHRRLNKVVENKSAVDAELADFRENERFEDFFVISGLPQIPSSMTGKDWQARAIQDVQVVVRQLINRDADIIVVQNATARKPDSEVTYNVKLSSVDESRSIRRKFGSYFLGNKDSRPDALKAISIKNRVTPDTRIRISLLKLMAKRYKDSNAGAKVQVIGYDPRPLLKITPPAGSSDRRVRVYNYIEACRSLPTTFSAADLAPILRRINPRLKGSIRSTFFILSDDQLQKSGQPSSDPPVTGANSIEIEIDRVDNVDGERERRGVRRGASSPPGSPVAKR